MHVFAPDCHHKKTAMPSYQKVKSRLPVPVFPSVDALGLGAMQRNEVIDLRKYRGGGDEKAGNEVDAAMDELPPGTRILHGQYTITGYLNSGGFGITYRAKDSLGRDVVIKECFPGVMCFRADNEVRVRSKSHTEEFADMVQNFVKEAHALATLDHKNIVKVHQVFEENQTAYMAIDYIDGLDLLAVIEEDRDRLGPQEIETLTRKTLGAIKYVHDRGMLHRDISPDNILLDANNEPILIDFGAAREKAKQSGRVMSRLKFVKDGYSPQEFYVEGSDQGPWSDLYSFAASLYHLISGAPPEEGQKRMAALAQKQADPYLPLKGRIKGYSAGFLESIDTSLQVVPRDRFQSADEWLGALAPRRGRRYARRSGANTSTPRESETTVMTRVPTPKPVAQATADVGDAPDAKTTTFVTTRAQRDETPDERTTPTASSSTLRASALSPEERAIRESLKRDMRPDRSRSPALMLGLAAVAVISALGTVGLFLLGGGDSAGEPQSVETMAAAPAELPPVSATPDSVPAIVEASPDLPSPDPVPAAADSAGSPADASATELKTNIAALEAESAPTSQVAPVETQLAPVDIPFLPMESNDAAPEETAALPVETAALAPEAAAPSATDLATAKPRRRPEITPPTPDHDSQFADFALALNEPTELPGLPKIDPARLVSNQAPTSLLSDGVGTPFVTSPAEVEPVDVAIATFAAAPARLAAAPLPDIAATRLPIVDATAPAPLPEPVADGPLVARQVQYSHWDVDMPFTERLERLRNANTARIVEVAPEADLSVSGEWIDAGVTIYTFNGETLMPETPLSVHVLTSMNIDPDGYARATVRYQPDGGQIDRGLLAVPVVREIGLADGTTLEARMIDRAWTISVMSFGEGSESTLRVGDRLVQEVSTGIEIAGHEDLTRALDSLVASGIDTAQFNVIRSGALMKATHRLARETSG